MYLQWVSSPQLYLSSLTPQFKAPLGSSILPSIALVTTHANDLMYMAQYKWLRYCLPRIGQWFDFSEAYMAFEMGWYRLLVERSMCASIAFAYRPPESCIVYTGWTLPAAIA